MTSTQSESWHPLSPKMPVLPPRSDSPVPSLSLSILASSSSPDDGKPLIFGNEPEEPEQQTPLADYFIPPTHNTFLVSVTGQPVSISSDEAQISQASESICLPQAPQNLPSSSPLLTSLPPVTMIAIIQSLSRDLQAAQEKLRLATIDNDTLVNLLKQKGSGDGEIERSLVRGQIEHNENRVGDKEWRILISKHVQSPKIPVVTLEEVSKTETEETLDLEDLTEAMESELSFINPPPGGVPEPIPIINTVEPVPTLSSISKLTVTPTTKTPSIISQKSPSPSPTAQSRRTRNTSLSYRFFGTLGISSSTSTDPPAEPSNSTSASTTPGTTASSSVPRKRHGRSGSFASISSIASVTSGISEAKSDSGYSDWIPWRTWGRSGKEKLEDAKTLMMQNGETLEEEDENETEECDVTATIKAKSFGALDTPHSSQNTTSTASSTTADIEQTSVNKLPSPASSSPSPSSSKSPSLHSTATGQSRRVAGSLSSSRPRQVSMPLVISSYAEPALSTPDTASVLSTPIIINSNAVSMPAGKPASLLPEGHPTHFTAITYSAGKWASGSKNLLFESAGDRVRQLADALLANVAASGPPTASQNGSSEKSTFRQALLASAKPFDTLFLPTGEQQQNKDHSYVSHARGTITRALGFGAPSKPEKIKPDKEIKEKEPNLTLFPKLPALMRQSRATTQAKLYTPQTSVSLSAHPPVSPGTPFVAPVSMELGRIGSVEGVPPTFTQNNSMQHGRIVGGGEEGPLVDRYGFVYDVRTGMKLLREARRRQERANKGEEEEEDVMKQSVMSIDESAMMNGDGGDSSSTSMMDLDKVLKSARELATETDSSKIIEGSSFVSIEIPESSQQEEPTRKPGHLSMKRLLAQLTEMQDAVEKSQKEAWEVFINKRQKLLRSQALERRAKTDAMPNVGGANPTIVAGINGDSQSDDIPWGNDLIGVNEIGVGGKRGRDDWAEFKTLVRKGVPIAFRAKIWAECSGANDIQEPGVYQELLSQHGNEVNHCLNQIDMDCHRTFPTNVFFAGSGPGVAKLRNVLVAYSYRNPQIGYCQGMNNLTATLLLMYQSEEEAFWVLTSLIERILPSDYYTSRLLVSLADQRVLRDLVARSMPDVFAHLEDLDVELPAITFGWFLSLFTDCLPIQTLLRIWDLLFVYGNVILFRIALAILKLNAQEILACDNSASLYVLMRSMTNHLYQVDRLLTIACDDMKNDVKEKDIVTLRSQYVSVMQIEMAIPEDEWITLSK